MAYKLLKHRANVWNLAWKIGERFFFFVRAICNQFQQLEEDQCLVFTVKYSISNWPQVVSNVQ